MIASHIAPYLIWEDDSCPVLLNSWVK